VEGAFGNLVKLYKKSRARKKRFDNFYNFDYDPGATLSLLIPMSPDSPPSTTAPFDEEAARRRFLASMGLRAPMSEAAGPDSFAEEEGPVAEEEDEIALSSRDEDFELPGVPGRAASNLAESRGGASGCRIEKVEFAPRRAAAERHEFEDDSWCGIESEAAPLLPLACPKCQGELVLKREHLGIEGACVWCGAEIVATESGADRSVRVFALFQPGKPFREQADSAAPVSQSPHVPDTAQELPASGESAPGFSDPSPLAELSAALDPLHETPEVAAARKEDLGPYAAQHGSWSEAAPFGDVAPQPAAEVRDAFPEEPASESAARVEASPWSDAPSPAWGQPQNAPMASPGTAFGGDEEIDDFTPPAPAADGGAPDRADVADGPPTPFSGEIASDWASAASASEAEQASGEGALELDPPVAPDPEAAGVGFAPAGFAPAGSAAPSAEPLGTEAPEAGFSGWGPASPRNEGLNHPPANAPEAFAPGNGPVAPDAIDQSQGGPAAFGFTEPTPAPPAPPNAREASGGFLPSESPAESQAQPSFAPEDAAPAPLESGFRIESAPVESLFGGGAFPFGEDEAGPPSVGEFPPPPISDSEPLQEPTWPAGGAASEESFSNLFAKPASKEATASFFSSPADQGPAVDSFQAPGSEALAPPPAAIADDARLPETGGAELEAPTGSEEGRSAPQIRVESKPLVTPVRSGGPRKGFLLLMMVIVGLVCGAALASFVLPVADYIVSARSFMESLFPSASGSLSGGFALLKTGLSCAER